MKTTPLLGFLLAVACAQGAYAASYVYPDQPTTSCEGGLCLYTTSAGTRFAWTVINELLLPRGIMLNARVDTVLQINVQTLSIVSPYGTYFEATPEASAYWTPTAVMPESSFLYTVWRSDFSFETNRFGETISWRGCIMEGGSGDYCDSWSSESGRGYGSSIYAPSPASVPIPAALPLLTLALGALGLAARRRRG